VRIDIRRGDLSRLPAEVNGEFEAIINPLFNGQHGAFSQPKINTWGELVEAMKSNGY